MKSSKSKRSTAIHTRLHSHPTSFRLWLLLLIVLSALALSAWLADFSSNNTATTNQAVSSTSVSIQSGRFFPQLLTIKNGATVTWTNYDSQPHQIASDPYPSNNTLTNLGSDPLNTNDSYSYTFDKTGTYTYHDQMHPYKTKGTIKVE